MSVNDGFLGTRVALVVCACACACAWLAAACGTDSETPSGPDAGAGADALEADAAPEIDLTGPMFDPARVLAIEIELSPADWDDLRTQTRSMLDVLGSKCLEEPPPRPYTYFPATITIDGEVVEMVGVRKKGFFGSLSTTKPSLKVKFNEYVDKGSYSGLQRLTLNNAISDTSYVKQCIGYSLFRRAGVPASRCNFATVSVNGTSLGLYVHVESIKKQFLRRHFSGDEGNMYEGALSDFRAGWVKTFQRKTNKEDADRSDIEALVPAVQVPDSQLLDTLEPLVDVDAFIDLWATEVLVMHADGYARNTNNFYFYRDPESEKFYFIPWGIDSIMFPDTVLPWEDQLPPKTIWAEGVLARRLHLLPETRTRYLDRLRQLLDTIWDEDAILDEIDRMEALIAPYVHSEEEDQFQQGLTSVRDFVSARRGELEPVLEGSPEIWDRPLRDPWCIDEIGSVTATFSTTWGTLLEEDVFSTGTGTLNVVVDGTPFVPGLTGSKSGIEEEEGQAVVQVVSLLDEDTALFLHLAMPPESMTPGTHDVDWVDVSGYVVQIDFPPESEPIVEIIGIVGDGTLELTQASTVPGAPVSGSISSVIYEAFF